jgi:hypothetical protein
LADEKEGILPGMSSAGLWFGFSIAERTREESGECARDGTPSQQESCRRPTLYRFHCPCRAIFGAMAIVKEKLQFSIPKSSMREESFLSRDGDFSPY